MAGPFSLSQFPWWLLVIVVLAVVFAFKRLSQISAADAGALLAGGALVLDVRGSDEFAAGHIDGAVNVPLGILADRIGKVAPDHATPILVHCLSGTRSALAQRLLKNLGYASVHNLGSLARARAIVGKSAAK